MLKHIKVKSKIIEENQTHNKDSGSVFVQIALVSDRISYLSEHIKVNKFDYSANRSLVMMVQKRRKMLRYLAKNFPDRYEAFVLKMGLKVKKYS